MPRAVARERRRDVRGSAEQQLYHLDIAVQDRLMQRAALRRTVSRIYVGTEVEQEHRSVELPFNHRTVKRRETKKRCVHIRTPGESDLLATQRRHRAPFFLLFAALRLARQTENPGYQALESLFCRDRSS